jgi:hypothetical protein
MSRGDKPSCIEEIKHDPCFCVPLYRRLQKLVGNDKNDNEDFGSVARDKKQCQNRGCQQKRYGCQKCTDKPYSMELSLIGRFYEV